MLIVLNSILFSCNNIEGNQKDLNFSENIRNLVDSLYLTDKDSLVFINNYLSESTAKSLLDGILFKGEVDSTEKFLLNRLRENFGNDSLYSFVSDKGTIVTNDTIPEENITGLIGVSNPVYTDDKEFACMYLAIECGRTKCGGLYSVFFFKNNKKKVNDLKLIKILNLAQGED